MDSYAEANEEAKDSDSLFEELLNGIHYYVLTWQGKLLKKMLVVPDELIAEVFQAAEDELVDKVRQTPS